ncbi:extracellular solute-binding protein [Paenibacillus dokdonensis]|uniref:Extracellular solute-binding protein n=1 Tax=Paenibacillus dokdonensis TaxID=2567944 RepID=A0ABU6GSE9_9BACL|nr:extracellular solute-binding protein [Paenibacillus dokdonensis]MEC0242643.1 extracellular solute-binding protein [Paenibacillus dokdonensis]
MTKKKWIFMLFMGVLMTATTACGSGSSGKVESKEKQTTKGGKTVLTLSIQESNPFYQALEKKFEAKYPDIDLQINSYKNMGEQWGSSDYEKYKKTMNTAILSGKGTDIIEVGSLPIDEYVSKQVLLNMNDYMEQDKTLNKSDVEMGVLDAMKLNDGIYTVPSGFFLRAFIGDGDVLKNTDVKIDEKNWSWKEFGEISKKIMQRAEKGNKDQRYALANNPPDVILQEMIVDSYAQFVDTAAKKAKFDSPAFMELMQQIKKMYDEKIITSAPADVGNQLFYSAVITSPADFIDGPHSFFENPKLLQKPHDGQSTGGMRIIPSSQFAIQAKSPAKDEAWKFITFLLSEEAQSLQDREGFSLLKSVNEKMLNDIQEKVKSAAYKLPNGSTAKVSDEEFTQFKQLINSADQYASLDSKVIFIVGEESISFFSGQKSAEEVAKLIQNRTTIYLNE